MKKFICAAAVAAVGIMSVISLGGCKAGEAYVEYTLSESGDYYIVSGVSGDRLGLTGYEVPAEYSAEEDGELLPVKEIGEMAFYECFELKEITIPDTVEKIGTLAFAKCGFSEFIIPDSVTEIGGGAFGMCDSLTEITVPESVEKMGNLAFYCCTSLEKAYVKASITVLEEKVFFNTVISQGGNIFSETSLKEVYLPAGLEKIHVTALSGNAITDIYFAGTETQWNGLYFFEMVKKQDAEDEYEEKRIEKSAAINKNVKIHYNAEF
ncbi:MAG: leucine-rich repeat domain-containing protein [Clostridia bacterium]|nr:leucine-rich repeat domain-containing protein [Clostridia bacterium]